jgi:hypothetical protein
MISEYRIKEGVFLSPQTGKIMRDSAFVGTLSAVKRDTWGAIKAETINFFGNFRAENYESLVYEIMGCKM